MFQAPFCSKNAWRRGIIAGGLIFQESFNGQAVAGEGWWGCCCSAHSRAADQSAARASAFLGEKRGWGRDRGGKNEKLSVKMGKL